MQKTKPIYRGEIYYADLRGAEGSEQDGIRPAIVIQNNLGNKHSPTTIVCAVTGRPKKPLPTHTEIGSAVGLTKDSFALLEQLRTIDHRRIGRYIGRLDESTMVEIDKALAVSVGLAPAFF